MNNIPVFRPFRSALAALIIILAVLLAALPAFCQLPPVPFLTYSPIYSDGNTAIERGEMLCKPLHLNTFWGPDDKFTSFAGLKVLSDNTSYNLVISKDSKTDELASLTDRDFTVMNDVYTPVELNSDYLFSFTGDPIHPYWYETSRNDFAPYKVLSRDYYGVSAGTYGINVFLQDLGTVPVGSFGSVSDELDTFSYDLYIMDFVQQGRILPCENTAVPITLLFTPSSVPNISNLSISVEWDGASSDLYEDSACTLLITGANNTKTWSAAAAPSVIYFKRSSRPVDAAQYTVRLIATVDFQTRILAEKKLQTEGGFAVSSVEGGRLNGGDLKGWWTGELAYYGSPEWQDNSDPYDFDAVDVPGSSSGVDKNRPLLYEMGERFMIHKVYIYHGDGITYSPDDYYLQAVSNDDMLNVPANTFTDANGVMEATNFSGSFFSAIECKDVFISWRLVKRATGETIKIGETKHKLYVVKGSLDEIPFHTVVDFSCSAARGLTADEDIIDAIWTKLQTLRVVREDGGLPFKYWGAEASIGITGIPEDLKWYNRTSGLIEHRDGRCTAWAEFVKDLFKTQGITAYEVRIEADCYLGYNDQEEWISFSGGDIGPDTKVNVGQFASTYQGGSPGAGPFNHHFINKINDLYYDATCGAGPYRSMTDFIRENLFMAYLDGITEKTISGDKLFPANFKIIVYGENQ